MLKLRQRGLVLRYRVAAQLWALRRRTTREPDALHRLQHRELWYRGIPGELEWWDWWLTTEDGLRWRGEVLDPARPVRDHAVTRLIERLPDPVVNVLEVGSGPITGLGYQYPGRTIRLTPVDALAREYGLILKYAGVEPPVKSVPGAGETLLRQFPSSSFDVAYASNSLDHCYDPVLVIRNMVALVKRGHHVVLRHYQNEGQSCNYGTLHQWNFDVRDGELIVWNQRSEHNVSRMLSGEAEIVCELEPALAFGAFDHNDWLVCTLRKL